MCTNLSRLSSECKAEPGIKKQDRHQPVLPETDCQGRPLSSGQVRRQRDSTDRGNAEKTLEPQMDTDNVKITDCRGKSFKLRFYLCLSVVARSFQLLQILYAIAASRSFTETTLEQPGSSIVMP